MDSLDAASWIALVLSCLAVGTMAGAAIWKFLQHRHRRKQRLRRVQQNIKDFQKTDVRSML